MATISSLQITIGTGDDDLRGDSTAQAYILVTTGGNQQEYSTMLHNEGDPDWENNTTNGPIAWVLPGGITTENLAQFGIRMQSHSSWPESPDNWNMNTIQVTYPDSVGDQATLIELAAAPIFRFTEHAPEWSTQLLASTLSRGVTVITLRFVDPRATELAKLKRSRGPSDLILIRSPPRLG